MLNQKKAFASKVSTSTVGQSLLKKVMDKETKSLMKTIRIIARKESGEKQSDRLNRDVTKLAVKIVILHNNKNVTDDDFRAMEFSFRRICSAMRNAFRNRVMDLPTAQRINGHITAVHHHIKEMLTPWVSEETIARLKRTIDYLGNTEFIMKLPSYPEEYKEIIMTFDHYLDAISE